MRTKVVMLTPTDQQIEDYFNDIAGVCAYTYGVEKTDLPAIIISPNWYADYAQKFASSKSHCLYWNYGILPVLSAFPDTIINLNTLMQEDISSLRTTLMQLQNEPDNEEYIKAADSILEKIKKEMLPINNVMVNLEKGTEEFTNQLKADTLVLTDISDNAADSEIDDEKLIEKLNGSIENLQQIIYDKRQLIKYEKGLKLDLIIFISGVKIVAGVVFDKPKLVVSGILYAIKNGYNTIVADDADVQAEQDEIVLIQAEMSEIEKTIATLQSISEGFSKLEQENEAAQKSISWIRDFWKTYYIETNMIMDDIQKMMIDINNKDISDAIILLEDLADKWNDFEEFASALAGVSYEFDPNMADIGAA